MSIRRILVALCCSAAFASAAVAGDDDHRWSVLGPDWGDDVFGVERHDDERGHGHGHPWWWRHRQPFTVKIIGFNDYHGNLQSPGTLRRQHLDPRGAAPGRRRRGVPGRPRRRS